MNIVTIEWIYSILQAILLKQNLIVLSQFVIDQQSEVINELCDKIKEAQKQTKKGIKAQKVSSEYYFYYSAVQL